MSNQKRKSYIGPMIMIIFGLLFLLNNLDILDFGHAMSVFWPLIIIVIGLNIIFRQKKEKFEKQHTEENVFSTPSQAINTSYITNSSIFGDVDIKILSEEFKGGAISGIFGDTYLDISNVKIAEGDHTLQLNGVFGDIAIILPKDIEVAIFARSVFGTIRIYDNAKSGIGQQLSYATPNYSSSTKKMRITLSQVFGNVGVK